MAHAKWLGVIRDGGFAARCADMYASYLRGMDGKEVEVIIRPPRDEKSNQQLAYFYGVICVHVAAHTGHTKLEVKDYLKATFLGEMRKSIRKDSELGTVFVVPSLADISRVDMSEFIERCLAWAAQYLGIKVPASDEVGYI